MGKPKKKLSAYNLYMRRALKGKMAGKTKAQRKAIFKAAARGWNKGKPRSTSRSSKPKSRASPKRMNATGGNRRMPTFNTQKLFKWVRIGSLLMPAVSIALTPGTLEWKAKAIGHKYTGVNPDDGTFRWEYAFETYKPFIFTTIITAVIPKISGFIKGLLK